MAKSLVTDSGTLYRPGAYSDYKVKSSPSGLATTGVLMLVGEADAVSRARLCKVRIVVGTCSLDVGCDILTRLACTQAPVSCFQSNVGPRPKQMSIVNQGEGHGPSLWQGNSKGVT